MRIIGLLIALNLAALCAAALADGADKAPAQPGKPAKVSQPIEPWLRLGPLPSPPPVFHDEKGGPFGLEEALKAEEMPPLTASPAEGREIAWGAGAPARWAATKADAEGWVQFSSPDGMTTAAPRVAWLAAYITTDRFSEGELELTGEHPRRFWLDGQPIASGGLKAGDAPPAAVKGKVSLPRGQHLLLVKTLCDPAREDAWRIGARFTPAGEKPELKLAVDLDPGRDIDIRDILDLPLIESLAVSPDGQMAAIGLSQIIPGTDDSEKWVETRSTADGRLLWSWRGGVSAGMVAWAPRGQLLSYTSMEKVKDKDLTTLWLADQQTGVIRPLLRRVEQFGVYQWLPDGRGIVYSVLAEPEADKRGIKRLEGLLDREEGYRTKTHLYLATVPDGTARRLTAGALSAYAASISPDSRRLLFQRTVDTPLERPFTATEVWELELDTLQAKLLRKFQWLGSVQYGPDGASLLVHGGPSTFGPAGVNVPEGLIPNEGDGQLFIWKPASGDVTPITRDFDPAVTAAVWSRADDCIYLLAEDREYARMFRYDAGQKSFQAIPAAPESLQRMELADHAPVAVLTGTSPWEPQQMIAVRLDTLQAATIFRPAGTEFAPIRKGRVEPWSFLARSGQTIDGRFYLPPDFDPSRRYPCIVNYYGGTSPIGREFGTRYPKEYWAAQGYVVYVPQPSGATGYGQAFSALHVNDWGHLTTGEVIEGTERFLEAHPFVDPARVGCIGASFGGFMTMRLLTLTDRFAAAVAHAGISSISSYWAEGYWGHSYSAQATAFSYPWNRPDVYVDHSPLFHADKVKTPLLLTHGADDTNVPVGESDGFYVALKLRGVPVEFLKVAGQNHFIMEHPKRILWSQSIVAWFDRWLKGQPEWWEALYPEKK